MQCGQAAMFCRLNRVWRHGCYVLSPLSVMVSRLPWVVALIGCCGQVTVVCRLNRMLWTDDHGLVALFRCNSLRARFCRLKRMLCFVDRILLLESSVRGVSPHTYVPCLHMLLPRVPAVGAGLDGPRSGSYRVGRRKTSRQLSG